MSERNTNILKIALLSVGVVVLIGFMVCVIVFNKLDFSFNVKEDYKVIFDETYNVSDIELIKTSVSNANVYIKYSDTNDIRVQVYDKDNEDFNVNFENNVLNVNYDIKSSFCFGFCFYDRRVVIYVPKEYDKKFEISSASGDILVDEFALSDVEVKTASGDVNVKGAGKVKIVTVSGDVTTNNIPNVNVKTTSGEMKISKSEDVVLSTTSGDADVYNVEGTVDISTVSGDVDIINVNVKNNSKISTVSGDVDIEGINLIYIDTSTVSGDVDVYKSDRYSNVQLYVKTTSGDIDIK